MGLRRSREREGRADDPKIAVSQVAEDLFSGSLGAARADPGPTEAGECLAFDVQLHQIGRRHRTSAGCPEHDQSAQGRQALERLRSGLSANRLQNDIDSAASCGLEHLLGTVLPPIVDGVVRA